MGSFEETIRLLPTGHLCQNDVVLTSMRRHNVASTLVRRHFTSYARWVESGQRRLVMELKVLRSRLGFPLGFEGWI